MKCKAILTIGRRCNVDAIICGYCTRHFIKEYGGKDERKNNRHDID